MVRHGILREIASIAHIILEGLVEYFVRGKLILLIMAIMKAISYLLMVRKSFF